MNQRSSGPVYVRDNVAALAQHDAVARIRERHITSATQLIEAPSSDAADAHNALPAERVALVRNCQIMKSALFNAGKRLERKQAAGQFTFALSGMYGFLVPLFTLQFEPFLTALVTYVVSFTAATAGAVSFVVAMLYQQQDLASRARARSMRAGLKINKLGKDTQDYAAARTCDTLRRFMHHYDEVLANGENHDEIDYQYSRRSAPARVINKDGRLDRWISQSAPVRYALCAADLQPADGGVADPAGDRHRHLA